MSLRMLWQLLLSWSAKQLRLPLLLLPLPLRPLCHEDALSRQEPGLWWRRLQLFLSSPWQLLLLQLLWLLLPYLYLPLLCRQRHPPLLLLQL
jgi:hypothetical protein